MAILGVAGGIGTGDARFRVDAGPGIETADPDADYVYRMRMKNAKRKVRPAVYANPTVSIDFGPNDDRFEITLRHEVYPKHLQIWDEEAEEVVTIAAPEVERSYVFACFNDNKEWANRPRHEWVAVATEALIKFASQKGISIAMSPVSEPLAPLNMMIELNGGVD